MSQAVQGGVGHHRIWEERDPVLWRAVTGNDDRRFEVSSCDNFIEVFCLGGTERREAEVIDDQEIRGKIFFDPFIPRMVGPTGEEEAEEFNGLGEEDIIAQTAGLLTQTLGDMTFPYSGRTKMKFGLRA